MRLIDADAAIDALCKSECGWNNAECRHKDGTDFYVTCDNVKIIKSLPSVQPEPEVISKWKKEFREYVDSLDIARDDWKGIIEYIDELPSAEPNTTTHDSIPAKTGKNDGDGTSGDCISRQRSVDTLRKMQTYKLFAGDDMLLIDQAEAQTELMMLPSAQPEQRWIPCSERLPEKEGWYITTVESEKTGKRRIENDLFAVDIALAHGHTPNKFCKDGYRQRTVAWMPFPEPYREGEQE